MNAEAIRSSAGARRSPCRVGSVRNTLKQLQAEGFRSWPPREKSRKLLYDADFRKPTVLVMGAEDTGISKVLKLRRAVGHSADRAYRIAECFGRRGRDAV